MSNFIAEYLKGQSGGNKGLPLGPGLEAVSKAINGLQRGMMIGVAAAPKVKENGAFCCRCKFKDLLL